MPKNDVSSPKLGDLPVALALLSRLPLNLPPDRFEHSARAAWAFPLVGALLGAIAGGVGMAATALGINTGFGAGLCLFALILLTGALHEDGLADSADGLWGGFDRQRRLDIMKDSHIGSYGVLALGGTLILRWWGIMLLLDNAGFLPAMIALGALSRLPMVLLMTALPHARETGLSHSVGRPAPGIAIVAVTLAVLCGGGMLMGAVWMALIVTLLITLFVAQLAKSKIGGQTGDILGASQQLCEIALLILLAR